MLSLFKNLIRVNHDGILITVNDKIVFYNQQVNKIMGVYAANEASMLANQEEEPSIKGMNSQIEDIADEKKFLVKSMQLAFPHQSDNIET